jgi:hypothetical protein
LPSLQENTEFSQYLVTQLSDNIRAVVIMTPLLSTTRSNCTVLTGQLADDVRAVETQFSLCDDFLPQFALGSDIGRQFSDAWFAARQVLDLGSPASKPNPPNPPPPTP